MRGNRTDRGSWGRGAQTGNDSQLAACKTLGLDASFFYAAKLLTKRTPPTLYLTHALLRLCRATVLRRVAIYAAQNEMLQRCLPARHWRRGYKQICKKNAAAAPRSNTTHTKNTRRPSRSRLRNAPTTRNGQTCRSSWRSPVDAQNKASCTATRGTERPTCREG